MRGALLLVVVFALTDCGGSRDRGRAADAGPGISQSLARDRAARVSEPRYELSLAIPAERVAPVTGRETITFTLDDASRPLAIDFAPTRADALHAADANGTSIDPRPHNGHLIVPSGALRRGSNSIRLEFTAGDAPLNRNDDFLYTIFVPARAHEAFPCFDQPDLKARWRLTLTVPNGWETLANGAEASRTTDGDHTRIAFTETPPLSTYLFAFAAGRFAVERAERNGRQMRMLHRETDAQKVARNRDAIFDLHETAIEWMERYTGIPYPFGKFDFLVVPAFQFGGMEHPGAIFYNASGVLLDPSATQNQLLERASVIAHETSHMWFGDLVTMRWFDDVWMKEVLANFMAAKIVNPSFPLVNHDLRFLLSYYPSAYDVDRTGGTNAIRQPLENLNEAGTLYGAIIYQKAPIVMRQLETLLGADAFRNGLREYLRRHAFGNAAWPDLVKLLDDLTPEDLAAWSHAWVDEAGRPMIRTDVSFVDDRIARLRLLQSDPDGHRGLLWNQQLQVALVYPDHVQLIPAHLSGPTLDVEAARGRSAPWFILPNGAGLAYGDVHLDDRSLQSMISHLPEVSDTLTRGSAWVALWETMLDGDVSANVAIDLALQALPREGDELNVQRILEDLAGAFWTFTSDSRRDALAPRIERALRAGLDRAKTASLKGAYFATLRNVAITEPTLRWLESMWHGDVQVPGLTLSEADDVQLAMELGVRAVPGWDSILEQQVARTKNPDRKARLQFVRPALSSDPTTRDAFFASLAHVENRRHEAWVLDGLHYLHHPLRAAASEKLIRPSLEMLEDIQRTGDIFFPKRWMDRTLGGHRSPTAAQIVRTFVSGLPKDYPDRLRRIILSSADMLFRASAHAPEH